MIIILYIAIFQLVCMLIFELEFVFCVLIIIDFKIDV